ncbi:hypothetical protein NP233_g207 [Leucocoprinus birnbaumii]|uniref:F-box domain-containing protein n=1 Tax=Leucocoprinus birnbaumii TaxID=56174 RepID=A0AAD5W2F3_9AGAR|nr:hypothetical protein NP233_g207 [Leucocoprinus birnbaumii]
MPDIEQRQQECSARLQELDSAIAELYRQRANVCSDINTLKPILPDELLVEVLKRACSFDCSSNERDPHYPIVLSSVSRHWRDIIHSIPSFWTNLGLRFPSRGPRGYDFASPPTLKLLRLYFDNSGDLPVSLRVNFPGLERPGTVTPSQEEEHVAAAGPSTKQVFQYISNLYPGKINSLFIWGLNPSLPIVYAWDAGDGIFDNVQFPNIRQLYVATADFQFFGRGPPENDIKSIPPAVLPNLNHLTLKRNLPCGLGFPYLQLTTLELEDIPINGCYRLMRNSTNLVTFSCKRPRSPTQGSQGPPTDPVRLYHVKSFSWAFGFQEWDRALLQCVSLPALEVFTCEEQGSDGLVPLENPPSNFAQQMSSLQTSFLHQSPSLRVFKSVAQDYLLFEPRILVNDLPRSIEEVHLDKVKLEVANDFMRALIPSRDPASSQVTLLPQLKVLDLEIECDYWIRELVLEMIRARRAPDPHSYGLQSRLERVLLRRGQMYGIQKHMALRDDFADKFQQFVDGGLYLVTADEDGAHKKWSRTSSGSFRMLAPSLLKKTLTFLSLA